MSALCYQKLMMLKFFLILCVFLLVVSCFLKHSDSNGFVLPNYKYFPLRRNIRRGEASQCMLISLDCCVILDFTEVNESFELLLILCGNCVFSLCVYFTDFLLEMSTACFSYLIGCLVMLARTLFFFFVGCRGF